MLLRRNPHSMGGAMGFTEAYYIDCLLCGSNFYGLITRILEALNLFDPKNCAHTSFGVGKVAQLIESRTEQTELRRAMNTSNLNLR
jgi:hypothetical protein